MPPQQHRPGSSRLCQIQLMNTARFTAGANSAVPKSLVHARGNSPWLRRTVHGVAAIRRRAVPPFQKVAGIWIVEFPPRGNGALGGWPRCGRTRATPCMRTLQPT